MNANIPHIPEPWERLSGESATAFRAFCAYRDLPPEHRSIVKAAGDGAGPARERRFEAWSARNAWVARVDAWDQHLDRVSREAEIVEYREMGRRQARAARRLIDVGLARLEQLTGDLGFLSAADTLRFVTEGAKLERLAVGEVDPYAMPVGDEPDPQDIVRGLLEEHPDVAKQAAILAATRLRVARERAAATNGHGGQG